MVYRPADLLFAIATNKGTERANENLKYGFLVGYKNCNLSELLGVIINSFLPQRYLRYEEHISIIFKSNIKTT